MNQPNYIKPVKVKSPSKVTDQVTPDRSKLVGVPPKEERVNETVTSIKRRTVMDKIQQTKERGLKAIGLWLLRWIIDFVMDVFLSFGVHRKGPDGKPIQKTKENADGKLVPVFDDKGNPVYEISWGQTFITMLVKNRAEIGFIATVLGYQVFGVSVLEWLERLVAALGL